MKLPRRDSMAIAPIDLQTLFTQLDKVGRAQAAQRESQVLQQSIQGAQLQKKTEEHVQQVNEAQDTGEGSQKIGDRGKREQAGGNRKRKEQADGKEDEEEPSVFKDPILGKNIDISL